MKVKSSEDASRNYKESIPKVAEKYKRGVQGTAGWQDAAKRGQGLYVEKMQDPEVLSRREKGLDAVSDEEWKRAAADKGTARIGQGMAAGADKQRRNAAPYLDTLRGLELPERTSDPMTNVTNRVGLIATTLHNQKKGAV